MNVNMNILAFELGLKGSCSSNPNKLPIAYALPFESGLTPDPAAVYVVEPSQLDEACRTVTSLVCTGESLEDALGPAVDVLYDASRRSAASLIASIARIIEKYRTWERRLSDLLVVGAPLARYAAASRQFFENPFFLTDKSYRVYFHETETLKQRDPRLLEEYLKEGFGAANPGNLGEYPPIEVVHDLLADEGLGRVYEEDEPIVCENPGYDYKTLALKVSGVGGKPYALCIDGVLKPLTAVDRAHLVMLGNFISRALQEADPEAAGYPQEVAFVLDGLLEHRLVDERRISRCLERMGWKIEGCYACLVVRPRAENATGEQIRALLPGIAARVDSPCFRVFDDRGVVVVNLGQPARDVRELQRQIGPLLGEGVLAVGVSRPYRDFKDLYYYYRQGIAAVSANAAYGANEGGAPSGPQCVFYEDVALHDMLARLRRDDPATASMPSGLRALVEHDNEHGSGYVALLRAYLDAHLSIAETCRVMFLARNTCLYRIKRIEEIANADFDDPQTRLVYALALRLMERGE